MTAHLDKDNYSVGDNIYIYVGVADNQQLLSNLNIVTTVYKPDGTSELITNFRDDALEYDVSRDGIYTGKFSNLSNAYEVLSDPKKRSKTYN